MTNFCAQNYLTFDCASRSKTPLEWWWVVLGWVGIMWCCGAKLWANYLTVCVGQATCLPASRTCRNKSTFYAELRTIK